MADRHKDARGVIQDILGPVDAVTKILTRRGAIRGNHTHQFTTQWTYIVWGKLRVVHRAPEWSTDEEYGAGDLIVEEPGVAHAWEAMEDTLVLVFTKGPRSGEAYESDVIRLTGDERLLG